MLLSLFTSEREVMSHAVVSQTVNIQCNKIGNSTTHRLEVNIHLCGVQCCSAPGSVLSC